MDFSNEVNEPLPWLHRTIQHRRDFQDFLELYSYVEWHNKGQHLSQTQDSLAHSFLTSRTFRGIKPSAIATGKGIRTHHTNTESLKMTAHRQPKNADKIWIFANKKPKPNTLVFDLGFAWRREQDLNLRYLSVYPLSKRAHSTALTSLHSRWNIITDTGRFVQYFSEISESSLFSQRGGTKKRKIACFATLLPLQVCAIYVKMYIETTEKRINRACG